MYTVYACECELERERERERRRRDRFNYWIYTTSFQPFRDLKYLDRLPTHPGPRQVPQLELLEEGIYWLTERVKGPWASLLLVIDTGNIIDLRYYYFTGMHMMLHARLKSENTWQR